MRLVAYVDESEPRQDLDPGTYVLCAAILTAEAQEDSRAMMRDIKRAHQKKAHWHEESDERGRQRLIKAVASTTAEHFVVVRLGDRTTRSERRRRLCLERLCFELHALGVSEIVIESRGPSDRLDRTLVDTMRAKRLIDASLRIDHVPGPAEPLLWIPDVVCGAVSQNRYGNPVYLEQLRRVTTMIEV